MGCSCDTTGCSEKDTLLKTCQWMAHWAEGLAKDVDVIQSTLGFISGSQGLHSNYDSLSIEEVVRLLDTFRTIASGLLSSIGREYSDEGGPLLPRLAKDFKKIHEMCLGHEPIPTKSWFSCDDNAINDIQSLREDVTIVRVQGDKDYWRYRNYEDFKIGISKALECTGNDKKVAVLFADKKSAKRFFEVADDVVAPPGEDSRVNLVEYFKSLYPKGIKFLYRREEIVECDFDNEIAEERKRMDMKKIHENPLPEEVRSKGKKKSIKGEAQRSATQP